MSGWQLALRIRDDVASPLQNLLGARAESVELRDEQSGDGRVLLLASFTDDGDPIVMDAVGSWLLNLNAGDTQIMTRRESSKDWSDGWRAVLGSFQASARIWVVPPWDTAPSDAVNCIHLESSLAFGIGGHPTTRGTLNVLDRLLYDESSLGTLLDVGSGSGILALAAGRLGVTAIGVETDEDAAAEGQRNLVRNDLGGTVTLRRGRLDDGLGAYDVVVANLYPATIRSERDRLLRCTGQHLILSGFYSDMSGDIRALFPELEVVENYACDGWSVLHLQRTLNS